MTADTHGAVISLMLAVPDASAAAQWYAQALGATELWNLGGVVGLTVEGAPFFLGEPANNGWDTPTAIGTRTVRVEVFVDDPDTFIERAVAAGADGSVDEIRDHEAPWGIHRQGGFVDPFGHLWLVGDKSPLSAHVPRSVPGSDVGRLAIPLMVCYHEYVENRIASLVVDATDAELLAQFWAEALGWQIVNRGNYGVSIGVDGGPFEIDFRLVLDGPKSTKNRLHLDIKPVNRDQPAELDRLLALGARRVDVGQGERNWYVLSDPEGNEFCLCRP